MRLPYTQNLVRILCVFVSFLSPDLALGAPSALAQRHDSRNLRSSGQFRTIEDRVSQSVTRVRSFTDEYIGDPAASAFYEGVSRAQRALDSGDQMHQRRWYDDQLSCTLVGSPLQDLSFLLTRLRDSDLKSSKEESRSHGAYASRRKELINTITLTQQDLFAACKKLPWKLG